MGLTLGFGLPPPLYHVSSVTASISTSRFVFSGELENVTSRLSRRAMHSRERGNSMRAAVGVLQPDAMLQRGDRQLFQHCDAWGSSTPPTGYIAGLSVWYSVEKITIASDAKWYTTSTIFICQNGRKPERATAHIHCVSKRPFYISNNSVNKWTNFNNFSCTESWVNFISDY